MTGIWSYNTSRQTPSLDGCRRKVERAKHHIEIITADARSFLASCGYRFRRDHQGDPPSLILTVEEVNLPQVPEQFSIVAGEAIYQLRTTLDHLVFELIRSQNQVPTRKNSWPILTKKNMLDFEHKTKGVPPSALKLIESLQPYQMGARYKEHTLWCLRELNDWDKHNFVIRTFLAAPTMESKLNGPTTPAALKSSPCLKAKKLSVAMNFASGLEWAYVRKQR